MNDVQQALVAAMKAAMKSGDKPRLEVIRLMIAALKGAQLQNASDTMSVDQEHDVLRKMVKSGRDAIEQATAAGRDDIVTHESAQLAVIQEFLPQQLSGAELDAKVAALCTEIGYAGPKDTGRFMKEWMGRYKGLAEGRDVQAALQRVGTSG